LWPDGPWRFKSSPAHAPEAASLSGFRHFCSGVATGPETGVVTPVVTESVGRDGIGSEHRHFRALGGVSEKGLLKVAVSLERGPVSGDVGAVEMAAVLAGEDDASASSAVRCSACLARRSRSTPASRADFYEKHPLSFGRADPGELPRSGHDDGRAVPIHVSPPPPPLRGRPLAEQLLGQWPVESFARGENEPIRQTPPRQLAPAPRAERRADAGRAPSGGRRGR
jgi:hypothetical protein